LALCLPIALKDDMGYSPQLKAAGNVLAQWYGPPTYALAVTEPTLSVNQSGALATINLTVQ
jgi:hypothetical protein